MRAEDQAHPAFAEQLDRRQRGPDSPIVADSAGLEGNVEVGAQQHPLAGDLGLADARLGERQSQAPTAAGVDWSTFSASSTQRFE